MDPLLIGLLVVAAAVVFFVVEPLVSGLRAPSGLDEDEPSEEDFRKRAVLLALRDVEYDYHTGKLDDADYRLLRAQLSREALETLRNGAEVTGVLEGSDEAADDPIEAEIRRIRSSMKKVAPCAACGVTLAPGARFCGDCGARVTEEEKGATPDEGEGG